MYNMMGNVGFIIQSNIYRTDDAPLCEHHSSLADGRAEFIDRRGNKVLIGITAWNIFMFFFIKGWFIWKNRSRDAKWNAMTKEQQIEYLSTTKDTGNRRLDFRFIH